MISFNNLDSLKRYLLLIALIIVAGIPAIHKLTGEIPPEWFNNKFNASIIGMIPGGIVVSYLIIIILEVCAPVLIIVGMLKREVTKLESLQYVSLGFTTYYLLFVVLIFGNFLVEDYGGGFQDFMYLASIAFMQKLFFSPSEKNL